MENTSKQTSVVSVRDIAYYRRRQQNRVFSLLAKFFADEAESGHITRKEIAQRLSKDPAQITRWLSQPSNFELDTISDLLLAMGAEMDHCIVRFSDRARPNFSHPWTVSADVSSASNKLVVQKQQLHASDRSPQITASTTAPVISKVTVDHVPL
jgi:hypothetical protein